MLLLSEAPKATDCAGIDQGHDKTRAGDHGMHETWTYEFTSNEKMKIGGSRYAMNVVI